MTEKEIAEREFKIWEKAVEKAMDLCVSDDNGLPTEEIPDEIDLCLAVHSAIEAEKWHDLDTAPTGKPILAGLEDGRVVEAFIITGKGTNWWTPDNDNITKEVIKWAELPKLDVKDE